jgi:4'-phosphopantetheinyl transferase
MQLALDRSEVHLWLAFCADADDARLHERYRAVMTPEERERGDRFYFERDRARYRVTRALVRSVLSRYAPSIAHPDWRFEASAYGQPLITNDDADARSLSFNLTHTHDLVVLAVTRHRAVGVDTENMSRGALLDVADRFFAPSECAHLRALPPDAQATRFFELWTLKESYIKARGMGLSIPLDRFGFDLRHEGRVSLHLDDSLQDLSARWELRQLWPTEQHPLAVCVERLPGQALNFQAFRTVPLHSDAAISLPVARQG